MTARHVHTFHFSFDMYSHTTFIFGVSTLNIHTLMFQHRLIAQ